MGNYLPSNGDPAWENLRIEEPQEARDEATPDVMTRRRRRKRNSIADSTTTIEEEVEEVSPRRYMYIYTDTTRSDSHELVIYIL